MSQNLTVNEKILSFIQSTGMARLSEIKKLGIHPEYIRRLWKLGKLIKLSRGIYTTSEYDPTEHHSIAEVCKQAPNVILCLLSALVFHDLTTQMPHEIWIAIDNKARKPKIESPPIRVLRFSGRSLNEGVEEHIIQGCVVKVYNPAKTVADCFKYQNKIGLDVALEALHDTLRQKKATYNEILHYAKICRVEKIITPYLESIAWKKSEH
ncbi:transcriptional regulator [Opitutia bacterium SCGC AG-212-L18]|nr:transcriptional regulator [Opitutae bacterium SCGC AG-212-L18]